MGCRLLFSVCFMMGMSLVAVAQKTERVTATYTYYAPEHVSIEEARRVALQRAQLQAIADAFGTIVTQTNATTLSAFAWGKRGEGGMASDRRRTGV